VLGPFLVVVHRIDAEADDLGVALVEFGLELRHVAKLGGADRREILGMGEQDRPAIADEVVEIDRTLGRIRREIRRFGIDSERHGHASSIGMGWPAAKTSEWGSFR